MKPFLRLSSPALNRWIRPLQGQWQALTRRERRQLTLMAVLLPAALLWLFWLRPAWQTRQHWQQELPRLHGQAAELEQLLQENGFAPSDPAGQRDAGPWTDRLQASLAQAGLAARISVAEPDIRLEFSSPVSASALLAWLAPAADRLGLAVQQVRMERAGDDGDDALEAPVTALVQLQIRQQPWDGPPHDSP